MDGLEATRRIKDEMPQTSVMMVTMHENPDYLFEAVKAGAAGYVLKDASGERLLGAVRRTLEGESPLNQELAMRLLVRLAREREQSEEAPGEDRGESRHPPDRGANRGPRGGRLDDASQHRNSSWGDSRPESAGLGSRERRSR